MKCIRNNNDLIVILDSGVILQTANCTDELFEDVCSASCDGDICNLLNPVNKKLAEEAKENKDILDRISNSKLLKKNGDSIYWNGISELSMPKELVERVLDAEDNDDKDALEGYKNFWTLLSLNPDPDCRKNLFWFLTKWGMVISKTGLFIGYRNADKVKGNDYENIYTDAHTHTFKIRIGEMVSMPRQNCDCDSNVSCSRGLHISYIGWLGRNYFGDTGLVCLVNPADVVAVPHIDDYGKLRTCAYLPIAETKYDENGEIIPYTLTDGFEAPYVKTILYDGIKSSEETPQYKIIVPELPEISKESVTQRVLEIARTYMK